jgi:hypothetical protein
MGTKDEPKNPYSGVDIVGLDASFLSLVERSSRSGDEAPGEPPSRAVLSIRERRLFRFGILVGLGEWDLASDTICSFFSERLLTGPDLEQAVAESAIIKGWPVCAHLGRPMKAVGLGGPASVAEALRAVRGSSDATSSLGSMPAGKLTEREIFALGLGITWGARCWDT